LSATSSRINNCLKDRKSNLLPLKVILILIGKSFVLQLLTLRLNLVLLLMFMLLFNTIYYTKFDCISLIFLRC